MKKYILLAFVSLLVFSCKQAPDASTGATTGYDPNGNSLYHRTEEVSMAIGQLEIAGEVKEPGTVNLDNFYKREVFHKHALPDSEVEIAFSGAFRYSGYSLFDLLNPFIAQKKNADLFYPSIDLYVVVENAKGDKAVFSWSEIFHTHIPHQIIIATEWAPINPSKKEEHYTNSETWKLVVGTDLFALREIENPTKITVKSFDKAEYAINRDLLDPVSPIIKIVKEGVEVGTLDAKAANSQLTEYNPIFYGMGKGYHHAMAFKGVELRKIILPKIDDQESFIRTGMVCFAGLDGYRCVFSFGELFNRIDQIHPILAVPSVFDRSSFYRVFHPMDFYADRAVKALSDIYIFQE